MNKQEKNPGKAAHFIGAMLAALQTQYSNKQIIKMFGQRKVREMLKMLDGETG